MTRGIALMVIALVAWPVGARASEIEKLAWMAGSWAGPKDGYDIEEHWTAPRAGTMVGMHRDIKGGRTASFEFFRIVEDSAGIVLLSSPRGAPPTPFRVTTLEPRRVVFENAAHDFPQRILYWIGKGGALHARIEGEVQGKTESEDWRWTRSRLAR